MNKALFLDRDGVINVDKGYVYKKEDFIFTEGIFSLCSFFKNLGFDIFIITNQSGISRGYYSELDFNTLNKWMYGEFSKNNIKIKKTYYCVSTDDKNYMRKPNPGMILKAKEEYDIDLINSVLIGDKLRDIKAGINSNVGTLFLLNINEININLKTNDKDSNIKEVKKENIYKVSSFDEIIVKYKKIKGFVN